MRAENATLGKSIRKLLTGLGLSYLYDSNVRAHWFSSEAVRMMEDSHDETTDS